MNEKLQTVINYLRQWTPSFGQGDPTKDGVSINILTTPVGVTRYEGSLVKTSQLTIYCLYDKFIDSFQTATEIYNYLQKNKIISNELKVLDIFGPTRVSYKQNKNLFIVEFNVLGL